MLATLVMELSRLRFTLQVFRTGHSTWGITPVGARRWRLILPTSHRPAVGSVLICRLAKRWWWNIAVTSVIALCASLPLLTVGAHLAAKGQPMPFTENIFVDGGAVNKYMNRGLFQGFEHFFGDFRQWRRVQYT